MSDEAQCGIGKLIKIKEVIHSATATGSYYLDNVLRLSSITECNGHLRSLASPFSHQNLCLNLTVCRGTVDLAEFWALYLKTRFQHESLQFCLPAIARIISGAGSF